MDKTIENSKEEMQRAKKRYVNYVNLHYKMKTKLVNAFLPLSN